MAGNNYKPKEKKEKTSGAFILKKRGLYFNLKHLQIYPEILLKNKLMMVYLHPHLRNNAGQIW